MEVSIKNFRCWKDKKISLSNDGITLISGISGAGKSSLLEAIHFAISGEGRNIVSEGKTKCAVSVKFGRKSYKTFIFAPNDDIF